MDVNNGFLKAVSSYKKKKVSLFYRKKKNWFVISVQRSNQIIFVFVSDQLLLALLCWEMCGCRSEASGDLCMHSETWAQTWPVLITVTCLSIKVCSQSGATCWNLIWKDLMIYIYSGIFIPLQRCNVNTVRMNCCM